MLASFPNLAYFDGLKRMLASFPNLAYFDGLNC